MTLEQKHLQEDAITLSKKLLGLSPLYTNNGLKWSFDKFQTEKNLHNILSGALNEELNIQAEVTIKFGRGKFNTGNQYATVCVKK